MNEHFSEAAAIAKLTPEEKIEFAGMLNDWIGISCNQQKFVIL